MGKWLRNMKLQKKLILAYCLLAVVPMLLITVFSFYKTKGILLNKSYEEMNQDAGQTKKGLEGTLDAYEAIMDMLYMDQYLHSYVVMDYTELSYWDMFSYIDNRLNNIMTIRPDIDRISIYSTNPTLPGDNYYFYEEDDLAPDWIERAQAGKGNIVFAGLGSREQGERYIGLERMLNLYNSGTIRNILLFEIGADVFNDQMKSTDTQRLRLLTDQDGTVVASGDSQYLGRKMNELAASGQQVQEGEGLELLFDEQQKIYTATPCRLGLTLVILSDKQALTREATLVSGQILLLFCLVTAAAFLAIWIYTSRFGSEVNRVVYAAKKLGDGEFDYVLKGLNQDEIGEIGSAFNTLGSRIQALIQDNYEKVVRIKSSEINLLQEQINPHFLYNALAVISSMSMRENDTKTTQCVRYLADFYRISLNKGKQMLSIGEELELLKNYMQIQKIRFENSIEIDYEVRKELLTCRTLKLLLQPLVENSIKYGRRDDEQVLHIHVLIYEEGSHIRLEVQDDGNGIEPEKLLLLKDQLRRCEEGYGLKNVDIRVKLNFGEEYGVTIFSSPGAGTTVRVEIPRLTGTNILP